MEHLLGEYTVGSGGDFKGSIGADTDHPQQPPPSPNPPPSLVSIAQAKDGVFDAMTGFLTGEDKSLLAVSVQQRSDKLLCGIVSFLTERLDESLVHKLSDGDIISVLNMNKNLERLSLSGCKKLNGECLTSLMGHSRLRYINLRDFRFKGDEPTVPTPRLEWRHIRLSVMNFIKNCAHEHDVVKVVMPSEINIMQDERFEEFAAMINETSWPPTACCSSCNFNWVSCSPFGLARDDYHESYPDARTNMLFTQQTVCAGCVKTFCNDSPRFYKYGLREPYPKIGNCNTYFCEHCLEAFCSDCWGPYDHKRAPDPDNCICKNCKIYGKGMVDDGASSGRKKRATDEALNPKVDYALHNCTDLSPS